MTNTWLARHFFPLLGLAIAVAGCRDSSPSVYETKVDELVRQQLEQSGKADFIVVMTETADLSGARSASDWAERGRQVYETLTAQAVQSQASLLAYLDSERVFYRSFWVVNSIYVEGGTRALVAELAVRHSVKRIEANRVLHIAPPLAGKQEAKVAAVEWNIGRIRAPEVWSTFGTRGENIVVANIDTGVAFNHEALVNQYRGNQGASFDHNYNWSDPTGGCAPSTPCDDHGHGTHTMGTAVGDDGDPGVNQIGVAPRAKWIAAKACTAGGGCPLASLLAAGQWIAAPTDLSGQNPRPDLRPHVVNNSWGGGGGNPFYQAIVDSWVAAGIFPAFAAGNISNAPCGSMASPGDYVDSYAVGAFDSNDNIASFSARGPSTFGVTKPNVAAPGVNVRSSVPGGYTSFSGTSMATPHAAGTVALMWSAAPLLVGDLNTTRALLDQTAVDRSDLTCGGMAGNNNVWGEGALDAFEAVAAAPRAATGWLTGTVTAVDTGLPIAGATVVAVSAGGDQFESRTDAAGSYARRLTAATYSVTARAFGYLEFTATGVVVRANETTVQNFALNVAPTYAVSGRVLDASGDPIANATVTIEATSIPPATTDATGAFLFPAVPAGGYDITASGRGRCLSRQTQRVVVDRDRAVSFQLSPRQDSFGYTCSDVDPAYIEASNVLPLTGDDVSTNITLPFSFTLYAASYGSAFVCTNGFVSFLNSGCAFSNTPIPTPANPNAVLYPFWDDLVVDGTASVRTELIGSAPNRQFVIEWRNARFFTGSTRIDFEVVLFENGRILTQYRNIPDRPEQRGASATIGIEDERGAVAFQYSHNEAAIGTPQFAVLYRPPPAALVHGVIADANDRQPIKGASVRVFDSRGTEQRAITTGPDGAYSAILQLGTYTVQASATNYSTESAQIILRVADEVVREDFALATARAEVVPGALNVIALAGETKTRRIILSNTGSRDLVWETREKGGATLAVNSTINRVKNFAYDPNSRTTEGLYADSVQAVFPAAGEVIRSWVATGLALAWGVGYSGNVWISDPRGLRNHEYTVDGAATGRQWPIPGNGLWAADMALDSTRNATCQVNVGGDNGIYCWDEASGQIVYTITGSFPWTRISQRGLAYRADDDTFFIGGWNEGTLYHIQGASGSNPGQVIRQCRARDGSISGLAYNPAADIVWVATNSQSDTIYQLHPETCEVLASIGHPAPGFHGGGLEMDEVGNLWMVDQGTNTVYLIDSGLPAYVDVSWLRSAPQRGSLPPGGRQVIDVTLDASSLAVGGYQANLILVTNSGRIPRLQVPVRLIVTSYRQGVDVGSCNVRPGGDRGRCQPYLDSQGDLWAADQMWTLGSWGYLQEGSVKTTTKAIAGTDDPVLYQTQREDPYAYRFDSLDNGVYQVELRFAEHDAGQRPGKRVFDVIVENQLVVPALDIAYDVGARRAYDFSFFTELHDGRLDIRLITRDAFDKPVINALRVTRRPDQE